MSTPQKRVDYRKLEAYVRADCALDRPPAWTRPKEYIACTSRRPVTIAYLAPTGSQQFYLPGFEGQFYYRDLVGWTFYPVLLIV